MKFPTPTVTLEILTSLGWRELYGQLNQVLVLVATVAGLACAAPISTAGQPNYCPLRVRVLDPQSHQRARMFVTVYEKSGREIEKEQARSKDVEFCDLGTLPVTVVVGLKGCNQVTVKDVALYWKHPYLLVVTYDALHCIRESLPSPKPICQVLLRVMGPDGKWLSNASISFEESSREGLRTDEAGRALFYSDRNLTTRGSVIAPGYSRAAFSVDCGGAELREEKIKLAKQ